MHPFPHGVGQLRPAHRRRPALDPRRPAADPPRPGRWPRLPPTTRTPPPALTADVVADGRPSPSARARRLRHGRRDRPRPRHHLPLLVRGRRRSLAGRSHPHPARRPPSGRASPSSAAPIARWARSAPTGPSPRTRSTSSSTSVTTSTRSPRDRSRSTRPASWSPSTTTAAATPTPASTPTSRRCTMRHPMVFVWDDHDTADNSWRHGAKAHDDERHGPWEERLAAATGPARSGCPCRLADPSDPLDMHRSFRLGDLVELVVLDTRIPGRDLQAGDEGAKALDDPRPPHHPRGADGVGRGSASPTGRPRGRSSPARCPSPASSCRSRSARSSTPPCRAATG